jgi:hypothetical protein
VAAPLVGRLLGLVEEVPEVPETLELSEAPEALEPSEALELSEPSEPSEAPEVLEAAGASEVVEASELSDWVVGVEAADAVRTFVAPLLVVDVVASVMLKRSDWARISLRSSVSFTKLIRKPLPVGHPALGGLSVVDPTVPSTNAATTTG